MLSYLFCCMTRYQGHQSMSVFLIFQKIIKNSKTAKKLLFFLHSTFKVKKLGEQKSKIRNVNLFKMLLFSPQTHTKKR